MIAGLTVVREYPWPRRACAFRTEGVRHVLWVTCTLLGVPALTLDDIGYPNIPA
jgi:hypothetical protein